ncbi:MAG TPA: tetratricopeptide repeat protein [Desulfuromonadales bacterium]|nr:tetratricopeptide repeat protein [Desulfuromonadales bacterium]
MKTKDIQKIKKRLLREELRRQGKTRKRTALILCSLLLVLLTAAAWTWYRVNQDDILETRFSQASELLNEGDYRGSLQRLERLHREHPGFRHAADALFQSAEIYNNHLDEPRKALMRYLMLERDYPGYGQLPLVHRQVADIYKYQLEDHVLAISAYQKVLDGPVGQPDWIQYEVADSYFRLNNFEQARIEFTSLLKNYPDSELGPEVQFRIAVTYAVEGQLPEAEAAYRLVIEHWPDSSYAPEARFGLAAVLEEKEELQKALDILEELENYGNPAVLQQKIDKIRTRIEKKEKAI